MLDSLTVKKIATLCYKRSLAMKKQQKMYICRNGPLTTLCLTDALSQSMPTHKHASLGNKQSVKKAHGPSVCENHGKVFWGCADRNVSSNSCDVVYFACLSRQGHLSAGGRSPSVGAASVRDVPRVKSGRCLLL